MSPENKHCAGKDWIYYRPTWPCSAFLSCFFFLGKLNIYMVAICI